MSLSKTVGSKRKLYTLLNIILSILVQIVSIIIGLLIPHAIINVYGDEVNGLVTTVTQVFNFFQLLEGGVSVAAAVALYKPFSEGDTEKVVGIYKAIGKYYKKSGEILLILSVATSVVFAFLFRDSSVGILAIMTIVMITGLMNSCNFLLLGKFNVICDADQHTFVLHVFTITARVIVTVIQYVLILLNVNIILVELPLLLIVFIRLGLTYLYIRKRYPYILENKNAELIPFKQKNDALIIQIANLVKRNAPMLVIACTGNLVLLSIYNVYAMIFHATSSLFEMVSQSLTSNFGNLVVTESSEKVSSVYRKAEIVVTALISVVINCYLILTVPFMQVYSAGFDTNYIYPLFALLFAIGEGICNFGILPRLAAISCGYIKESRNPAIIEASCAFLIGLACYLLFGFNGLMIGCIIGSIVRTGYHIFLVSKRILKEKIIRSLLVLGINAVLICATYFASFYLMKWLNPDGIVTSYFSWVLIAVAVFVISAIIIFGIDLVIYKSAGKLRRK